RRDRLRQRGRLQQGRRDSERDADWRHARAADVGDEVRRRRSHEVVTPDRQARVAGCVEAREVEVPDADEHYEPLLRSSATIAGTISCRSPITAQSARATIGAFRSLLITRIRFAPLHPTMCWIAPLTPHAM